MCGLRYVNYISIKLLNKSFPYPVAQEKQIPNLTIVKEAHVPTEDGVIDEIRLTVS